MYFYYFSSHVIKLSKNNNKGPSRRKLGPKTDPSQKSATLKRIFHKIRDLTADPKIKNYHVIFYVRSAAKEFTRKWLINFIILHFFVKKNHKDISFHRIISKIHKNWGNSRWIPKQTAIILWPHNFWQFIAFLIYLVSDLYHQHFKLLNIYKSGVVLTRLFLTLSYSRTNIFYQAYIHTYFFLNIFCWWISCCHNLFFP